MSVIQGNAFSDDEVDTGDIGHSLRFRGAQSITRTAPASVGSQNVWTWSGWVKQGTLGSSVSIFGGEVGANSGTLQFNAANHLYYLGLQEGVGATYGSCQSVAVFRDPTAPIHVVINFDGGRSAADRIRMYVNGVQLSTTNPIALTATQYVNAPNAIQAYGIRQYNGPTEYLDGYVSRGCFIDGTTLTPSSFGYLNTEINEWVTKNQSAVKAVVDAGGANSSMLDFDDATSLTTLGYDKSSKGNNWTLNNFSLTAGTTYDHMLDVPGNSYATLNPSYPSAANITNGNLSSGTTAARGTLNSTVIDSQWFVTAGASAVTAGVIDDSGTTSTTSVTANKVFAFKMTTAGALSYKNVTDAGSWTSIATGLTGNRWPYSVTQAASWNFGQQPLPEALDTGYKALCQANLPTPAILNTSSAVAHRFEAGSGIATAIASDRSGWSDWMEWFKRTDTTESWKIRFSDDSGNMMAFDTNGAKAAWSAPSTGTYLGTAFKVGATYGVVTGTYSGDSTSNKNISHSLGKAPTCGIVKNESTGTWYVWHTKMTSAAYFTTLNSATPPAQSNTNTPWGTGNWSSTQFMVTNNATNNLNATGSTYRYILFADIDGLLALLGHTGNASTDGAFESSGHKAQLLIEKDLSATTGFYLWSDKIDTYNVTASYLLLNTNAGTAAATGVDICSNAVKYRSATIANASNPHMGISYSRTPGKYSLGR